MGEFVVISVGMGWYFFFVIEFLKVSVELGGIVFLFNIFRELLVIFLIFIIVKKIGLFEFVFVVGVIVMDLVLLIINKSNFVEIFIILFYIGFVILIVVLILILILVNIFLL